MTITVPLATDDSVSIGVGRRVRAASPPAFQGATRTYLIRLPIAISLETPEVHVRFAKEDLLP